MTPASNASDIDPDNDGENASADRPTATILRMPQHGRPDFVMWRAQSILEVLRVGALPRTAHAGD